MAKAEFGGLRAIFWPIHRSEAKKVLSMLILLFLLCVTYGILRNLKDPAVLMAKASGAEVLPFLKVWGMLPGAFFATFVYTRLSNKFSREKVFYSIISGFLIYFLLFAFILYPNRESLHLVKTGEYLRGHLPAGFKGVIAMLCNWTTTSFYIICELWSVLVMTVLFWGFANEVTKLSEAKRSYGILNIGSNIAPMVGATLVMFLSNYVKVDFLTPGGGADPWGETLVKFVLVVTILGVGSMLLFRWMHQQGMYNHEEDHGPAGVKKRLSIRKSLKYLITSPYLMALALVVLSFNTAINFTDILWKAQLKSYFGDAKAIFEHMNKVTFWIGVIATFGGAIFSVLVRRFGWTFVAILTPLLMFVMAIGFFTFFFGGEKLSTLATTVFGASPLALTVYFGSVQNCLSKAGKYSMFDASKELAFIPLTKEARRKGKAAIDGFGSGVGKSGASMAFQVMLISLGSVAAATPFIAIILFVVFGIWGTSAIFVGRKFKAMGHEEEEVSAEATPVKV